MVTEEQRAAIAEELRQSFRDVMGFDQFYTGGDALTILQLAALGDCSYSTAAKKAQALCEQGKMRKVRVKNDAGRAVSAYVVVR